jgi:hypothetical protein
MNIPTRPPTIRMEEIDIGVSNLPTFYHKLFLRQVILDNSLDHPTIATCEAGMAPYGNLITHLNGPEACHPDCRKTSGNDSDGLAGE